MATWRCSLNQAPHDPVQTTIKEQNFNRGLDTGRCLVDARQGWLILKKKEKEISWVRYLLSAKARAKPYWGSFQEDGQALQSLRFPWSLTAMSKLSHVKIGEISEDFLSNGFVDVGHKSRFCNFSRNDILRTYRLVIRILTEIQLNYAVAVANFFGQDFMVGNAFIALLAEVGRANPDSLLPGSRLVGRPITIRAMARSFHRPYETMRRAVRRLSELGLAELREEGVVLRSGFIDQHGVHDLLVEMHDITVTLIDNLFVFAKLPKPDFVEGESPEKFIKLASLELHLLSVEGMQSIFSDWTGLLLIAAISAGNIRDVTYDSELAFTYAAVDKVPPMHLRRPVYFKVLCDTLPICPTTAWRRIAVMKIFGSVTQVEGGLIIDGKWFKNLTLIANACDRIERMHSIINRMALSGVSMNKINNLYISGMVAPIYL
jgi:hypothetical protein